MVSVQIMTCVLKGGNLHFSLEEKSFFAHKNLLFLIKKFFYKMHKMLTAQRHYLHHALLIILITNVKAC